MQEEVITDKSEWSTTEPELGRNKTSDEIFVPGLNLSRKARRNMKRRQKRIALKEQEEEEKRSKEKEKQHRMTEYLIQSESKKVIETIGIAATDETELEEVWNGKIPAICSTPEMTSLIGKEIQEEYRRNLFSKKRKFSPEIEKNKNQKAKPNTPQNPGEEHNKPHEKKDHNFENLSPTHKELQQEHREVTENKEDLIIFGKTEYGNTGYLNTSENHSYTL